MGKNSQVSFLKLIKLFKCASQQFAHITRHAPSLRWPGGLFYTSLWNLQHHLTCGTSSQVSVSEAVSQSPIYEGCLLWLKTSPWTITQYGLQVLPSLAHLPVKPVGLHSSSSPVFSYSKDSSRSLGTHLLQLDPPLRANDEGVSALWGFPAQGPGLSRVPLRESQNQGKFCSKFCPWRDRASGLSLMTRCDGCRCPTDWRQFQWQECESWAAPCHRLSCRQWAEAGPEKGVIKEPVWLKPNPSPQIRGTASPPHSRRIDRLPHLKTRRLMRRERPHMEPEWFPECFIFMTESSELRESTNQPRDQTCHCWLKNNSKNAISTNITAVEISVILYMFYCVSNTNEWSVSTVHTGIGLLFNL